MTKTVSVLIPTMGRTKELIDTVSAINAQTVHPSEIIVGDQNSTEIPEVTRFLKTIPNLKHLRGLRPGLVANYNSCLEEASGEIILFVDDDIIPRKNLLERHLQIYRDNEEKDIPLGAIAGRVHNAHGDKNPGEIQKIGCYNKWTGQVTANFNGEFACEVQFAQGAQMSFKREALKSIGGFDEGFVGNGYFFETDGCLRLKQAGYKILFDPGSEVEHLMAGMGGARISNKAIHTHYFVRNGLRLYRRHSPALGLPFFTGWNCFYVLAKAAVNRDGKIISEGVKGIAAGLATPL